MKLFRTLLKVSTLAAAAVMVAGQGHADEKPVYKIRWVIAHEPIAAFEKGAKQFADLVKTASHGKMQVEVMSARQFNGGKPISEQATFAKLAKGEYEMSQTVTTFLGSKNPQFMALDLPFLFRSHEHAAKVLDGEIGHRMLASIGSNMKGLAFTYSGGYRIIPSKSRELHSVNDFKGMRVRVSAYSNVGAETMKLLGAVPTAVSPEAGAKATSMDNLDAMESTLPRYWDLTERDSAKVVNETEHSLFLTAVIINGDFYNKLPKEYQKYIDDAAMTMAKTERQDSINRGKEIQAELASKGFKVVKMDNAELAKMKKQVMPVYDQFKEVIGADLIKQIQNTN